MKPEQPNNNPIDELEPLLEAVLVSNKRGHEDTSNMLENIFQQNEKNNPEPLLEAGIVQAKKNTDKIVEELKKPLGLNIEINGAETTMYKGEKGDKGDTGNIFDELTKEQKESIRGPKGDKGDKGDIGEIGPRGKQGLKGDTGRPGLNGRNGLDGLDGKDGLNGNDGIDGIDGKDGKDIDPEIVSKYRVELKKNEDRNLLWVNNSAIRTITAGTNITITGDPQNPIISATGGGGGAVDSVNGEIGVVVLTTGDIAEDADFNYVSDAQLTVIGNTSGTNTGDQTNISGNAATVTTNANLTGHITSVGNAAVLGSFTKAQLDTAVSDGNVMYIGDAPTAHTHALAAGATDVTSSAAELNILDGATLSTTELNYVDGVTSAIQTQLNAKLALAGGTMSGNITLGENTAIALDPAGSADGKYTGITVTGVAGYAQAFGDLVYLSSVDSRWELADADAATTADRMLAMVVVAGGSDGAACTLLLQGIIRADAKFPALTIGSAVYVGETAGAIQVAIPTGADNVIRRVGYAMTADEIYFNPSQDSQVSVA